jgi:hypothetical protein
VGDSLPLLCLGFEGEMVVGAMGMWKEKEALGFPCFPHQRGGPIHVAVYRCFVAKRRSRFLYSTSSA